MEDPRIYQIALTLVPNFGPVMAKNLVAYCGSPEAVFAEKGARLEKIPGMGKGRAKYLSDADVMHRAEDELKFIERTGVKMLFFTKPEYPKLLKACPDSPVLLYFLGNGDLNHPNPVAMVGTRNATDYGKQQIENLISGMLPHNPQIISGLAYGIDIHSHRQALQHGLSTVAVVAHGLDRVYPHLHKKTAVEVMENGGLLTEFVSGSLPNRENFPKRNRIIAGLSQAVIVVEAAKKGGALITAEIANTYNREVFAIPGRVGDAFSEGCNDIIRTHRAQLLSSVKDLEYMLGWDQPDSVGEQRPSMKQPQLFLSLTAEEEKIADVLKNGKTELDNLCYKTQLPIHKISGLLLGLEIKGAVRTHPGKVFEWVG